MKLQSGCTSARIGSKRKKELRNRNVACCRTCGWFKCFVQPISLSLACCSSRFVFPFLCWEDHDHSEYRRPPRIHGGDGIMALGVASTTLHVKTGPVATHMPLPNFHHLSPQYLTWKSALFFALQLVGWTVRIARQQREEQRNLGPVFWTPPHVLYGVRAVQGSKGRTGTADHLTTVPIFFHHRSNES